MGSELSGRRIGHVSGYSDAVAQVEEGRDQLLPHFGTALYILWLRHPFSVLVTI